MVARRDWRDAVDRAVATPALVIVAGLALGVVLTTALVLLGVFGG